VQFRQFGDEELREVLGMSEEANRRIARRFFDEVFSRGNLDVIDEIFDPDYVGHSSAAFGKPINGPEGIREFVSMYRAAFPNIHFESEDVIATDDQVVVRWTTEGTHKGDLKGIKPTGKHIRVSGIGVADIVNERIRVSRSEVNMLDMLQQLGAIEPIEQ
jgi:steroid delta-isomerase-like uncharacterized protein